MVRDGDHELVEVDGVGVGVDGGLVVDEGDLDAGAQGDPAGLLRVFLLVDEDDRGADVHERVQDAHVAGRVAGLEHDTVAEADAAFADRLGHPEGVLFELVDGPYRVG